VWPTASQKPGGYAQSTYATDAGGEIAALRLLLDRVELEGCWCKRTRCMQTAWVAHRLGRDMLILVQIG
jgi:hypothetical protein